MRADNGRVLILMALPKTLCYNRFIPFNFFFVLEELTKDFDVTLCGVGPLV